MIFILIAAGIFCLEHGLKEHINSSRLQGSKQEVLKGRVILRNCHNEGNILGVYNLGKEKCLELSLLTLGGVCWEFFRNLLQGGHKLSKLGLSMVLGGGMSNYSERRSRGYVTDYISFGVKQKKLRSMVFNLSDLFITAGAVLWAVSAFFPKKKD